MQRDEIIAEIRRTAQENGGTPLGVGRFEQVSGIRPYDWGKYWARFGDAQREAGFEPNKLTSAFSDDFLLEQVAKLTHELQRFPTDRERRLKRRTDSTFPNSKVFERFGDKRQLTARVLQYCREHADFADVVILLEPLVGNDAGMPTGPALRNSESQQAGHGFVYLVKGHPGEYKVGRTNLVDRRLSELGVTASVEQELVHVIETDDAPGIEDYWHKRLKPKHMRGEWFKLNATDVKAFKRWRRIY
jgi:hypothetical protein